jgi:hypothetical protein
MFKVLAKAIAALLPGRKARKTAARPAPGKAKAAGKPKAGARPAAAPSAEAIAGGVITPERAALIRHAMQVRAAKQTVLAELGDEQRARLVATAMKAMLNQGQKKEE